MTVMDAYGISTVSSSVRPECHAPSGYSVRDYSAKAAPNGVSPRDRQRDIILAFWESRGVARWRAGGAGGGGRWEARDLINPTLAGRWLPLATRADVGRSDRIEMSHVVPSRACGAWCACNVVPEVGAVNAARGDAMVSDMTPDARALLDAWPAWWRAHVARKASLERLLLV